MIATQIVSVETGAGGFTAYARTSTREHQATATSPELACRLAATGLHGLQLVDIKSAERQLPGTWKVSFKHGAFTRRAVA